MNFDPAMPPVQPIHPAIADSVNPAAISYAQHQLARAVAAHLIAPRSYDSGDPTAAWRAVSSQIGGNPASLQTFLASQPHPAQQYQSPIRYAPGSIDVQMPSGPLPPGQPTNPPSVASMRSHLIAFLNALKSLHAVQYQGRH